MKTKSVLSVKFGMITVALASLFMAATAHAQSLYSNAVMALNPVAYWPLQETTQPPSYDTETNLGSFGAVGNMYYASTNVWHSQVGAIAGDPDTAALFNGAAGSFALIPTTDNRISLPQGQPFTVECWTRPTSQTSFRGIISQVGPNNAGALNAANANANGWSLSMGFAAYRGTGSGNGPAGFDFHVYNGNGYTGGADAEAANTNCWLTGGVNDFTFSWVYLACVFDGTNAWVYMYSTNMAPAMSGTNQMQYYPVLPITTVAGAPVGGPGTQQAGLTFLPDTWDPLMIGSERGQGANEYPGYLDEIAIYTNALSLQQITNHFAMGVNGLGNYKATILGDQPAMYWRMGRPAWTPVLNGFPTAANYGSAVSSMTNLATGGSGANASVYQPGTAPGVPGPSYPGFGNLTNACGFNGLVGAVDLGYSPLLDPRGPANNWTLVSWFKGNPADSASARNVLQTIASHGTNSWNMWIRNGATTGSKGAGGQPTITLNQYNGNDGNWHMLALESSYVNGGGTNLTLSIDGGAVSTLSANSASVLGTNLDAWLGGQPDTHQPTNEASYNAAQQYFAGEVSHVAFYTNALTGAQISALYSAARPQPILGRQPVSGVAGIGGGFTNSVGATGVQLAYQWYKDNAPAANQTNSSFILNSVQASDASTNYFVVITNIYGTVTSSVWTLTVVSNLTFVAQYPITYSSPMLLYGGQIISGTNYLGSTPTFSVSAVGSVPIIYQWQTNGVSFGGATNPSLTFTNCQLTSPTSFDCVLSNQYGALTSIVWSVSYLAAPTAPFPQAVLAANPVGYWRLNEPDDGNFDGNEGATCNDYQSGDNGLYTNMYLHNVTIGTGYSPTTDPSEGAAEFGVYPNTSSVNCDAYDINNVNLSVPSGGNGEFTVALWANGNSFAQVNNSGLVTKGLFSGEEFTIDEGSTIISGGLRFYVRDALANGYDGSSSISLANNSNWHFVVGVCDELNGATALYVDGVKVGGTGIAPGVGIVNSDAIPLMIGARTGSTTSPGANQFRGLLNDVAIYNYAMTAAQIDSQYSIVAGPILPYFIAPVPPANTTALPNATLTIPATAFGTPPIGFVWTNVTSGGTLAAGATNSYTLNATLNYNNIPVAWNTNQLELIVTNAYGTTNLFVTLGITNTVSAIPTNITASVSGGQLTLSWPSNHTGWQLQAQTNPASVGIYTNWANYNPSTNTNSVVVPVNLTNGTVFYRLIYVP